MRIRVLYVLLMGAPSVVFAQEYERQNLWTGIVVSYDPGPKVTITADGGFRSFDHFTRRKKQLLGRFVVTYSLGKAHDIGAGFTHFNHYVYDMSGDSRLRQEERPFLQYQFRLKRESRELLVRMRDEFRIFHDTPGMHNRLRIQVRYTFGLGPSDLQGVISAEGFYTFQRSPVTEQRYNAGISIPLRSGIRVQPYYSAQILSTLPFVQHVAGFQLNLQIPEF